MANLIPTVIKPLLLSIHFNDLKIRLASVGFAEMQIDLDTAAHCSELGRPQHFSCFAEF
jgi:hypothetical protein